MSELRVGVNHLPYTSERLNKVVIEHLKEKAKRRRAGKFTGFWWRVFRVKKS